VLNVKTKEPPEFFFEDFTEGQELATITKGPMMVGNQVRWAGACDNYDSEWHHDEYVAKAAGLPGIILSGPLMGSYLLTAVTTDWLGRHAKVKRTYEEGGKAYVELDCSIVNQKNEVTTPGSALAILPKRPR
jgi:acyl dehydratase